MCIGSKHRSTVQTSHHICLTCSAAAQGILEDKYIWHADRVHSNGHGHRDGHQSAQPSGQTREIIIRIYLAPGVAFFHDVCFIIHTTKVVLLKM